MNNHSLKNICKFNKVNDYDSFVGLKIEDGNPIIYLPLGYNDNEDITSFDINNLILAIKKFGKQENHFSSINDVNDNEDKFPYFSYKWIIENYLEKGYYNELEYEEIKAESGKINWERTLSKPSEIFTKKGPIYTKFIVKKSNLNNDNLITRIHEFCVYESFCKLGWLFENKYKVKKSSIMIDTTNSQKYISIIKEELKRTFKDSKKELLLNMIRVIVGIDSSKYNKKTYECGTTKFYNVWEKMIDNAYSNIKNIDDYYPHGFWHFDNNEIKSSALIPDTIIIDDKKAYIYDSKYYVYCNVKNPDNLPRTDSIQKQITYAEYLETKYKYDIIYNVFVLPGNINNKIEYIGYATADWKKNDKTYQKIFTFMLDTKYIINNYNRGAKNFIKEYLKELKQTNH